jgi:hypothetical protein
MVKAIVFCYKGRYKCKETSDSADEIAVNCKRMSRRACNRNNPTVERLATLFRCVLMSCRERPLFFRPVTNHATFHLHQRRCKFWDEIKHYAVASCVSFRSKPTLSGEALGSSSGMVPGKSTRETAEGRCNNDRMPLFTFQNIAPSRLCINT